MNLLRSNVQTMYTIMRLYSGTNKAREHMGLQFLGYLNIKQEVKETTFNDKIKLEGDGRNNVTLTLNTLKMNDSCSVFLMQHMTQCSKTPLSNTKTSSTLLTDGLSAKDPPLLF